MVVCSAIQASALTAFLMTQDEIGLFTVSALFGLGFSGLVPAYVLTSRQFYPAREARWRVPALLLFSGSGMASGAWIGGALYDMFGYYGPAFFTAIVANLFQLRDRGDAVPAPTFPAAPDAPRHAYARVNNSDIIDYFGFVL